MRNVMMIALAAGLACTGVANASVLTYQFTATVTEIGDPNIYVWSDHGEGALAGSVVRSGQTITGSFSYDNASTPSPWNNNYDHYFSSENNKVAYTIASTGQQFQSTPGRQGITIENIYGRDGLWVEGNGTIAGAAHGDASASVAFIDNTMTAFPDAVLPSVLGMNGFSFVWLNFDWYRASDGYFMMGSARIDTLSAVNDVPEPASLGLVLAGLTAFGGIRRRIRQP